MCTRSDGPAVACHRSVTNNGSANFRFRSLSWRSISSLWSTLTMNMAGSPWRLVGDIDGASRLGPAGHRHLGAERVPHVRLLSGRIAQFRGGPGSGPQGHGVHAGPSQDHAGQSGLYAPGRAVRGRRGHHPVPRHRLRHPDLRQRPRGRPGGRPRGAGSSTSTTTRSPSRTARRCCEGNDRADVVAADLRKPQEILASPEVDRTARPGPAGGPAARRRPPLHRGRGRPVRGGRRTARRAGARQPARPHPRLVRGHPALPGGGGRRGRRLPEHPQPADHALARGDRAVLRGVRDGGARPRADARVAARHAAARRRRTRTPSRASPGWGARREHSRPGVR